MKLVIAVVHNRDKNKVTDVLLKHGYKFTIIGSTGGFLREGNSTMLIGVEADKADHLLRVVSENCKSREQFVNVMPPDAAPIGSFTVAPVKVAVIDTGIDLGHPEFQGRIATARSFVGGTVADSIASAGIRSQVLATAPNCFSALLT